MAGAGGWDGIGPLKPTLQLLQDHVIPRVASKWHELGIELYKDDDVSRLDTIQRQCPGDFTKGCTEMLSYWRQAYENATWNRLIKALKAPGLQLNAIASEIKRDVMKDLADDDSGGILSEKPNIWKLRKLVIPEVKAHWEDLAYSMDYEIAQIQAIERDGKDVSERCTKLLQDWLETNHGCTPKTWGKLVERMKDVDELYAAAERIKEKLIGDDTSLGTDKNPGKVHSQSSGAKNQRIQELLQSMSKARKDGCTLKVRYGKVLICGASAAGKTNFLKLLIEEEEFEPKHISTELAKHQQVAILAMKAELSKNSNEKLIFKKMDIDREIDQLMKYLPEKYTTPSIQKPAEEEEQRVAEPEIQQHTYTIAEKIICSKLPDTKRPVKSVEKVWNILTFIDTGGQPQFISMLPAVNSFAMITFIVHKMTGGKESLTQKVVVTHGNEHGNNSFEQRTHEYTYHQLIKTLMSYASSMLLPDKEFLKKIKETMVDREQNVASISFIGTHSKNVSENDIKEINDELINIIELSGIKNIKPYLNKNYKCLIPLDNKVQKEDFTKAETNNLKYTDPSEVCVYIHEWLEKQDTYSVPVQWLLLELEIRKVCIGKSFMTYNEVMELSRDKQLGEDDFIKNGLRFHHFFGVLLYYEIEGMPELIITDHQWLFKTLSKIALCAECCDTNKELDKCQKEGIFEEKLLDKLNISEDFVNSRINIELINPNKYFLGLLQHLRIIASLKKDPMQYFMPSLLKSCDLTNLEGKIPGTGTFIIEGNERINEPLLIQFVESFDTVNSFPRGIFCFLVVQLMHCSDCANWEVDKPAHDNMLSFRDTEHYITLIDRIFFLEVHVRPFDSDYNPVNGNVFIAIKKRILTALSEVGSRLDINIELEWGFRCKNCKESHIALKKKNANYYFCDDGKRTKLEKSHKLWFEKTCQDTSINLDHKPRGTVELRPTMRQLFEVMRIKNICIAVRWYDLGQELVDDNNILQLITADHGNDTYTCCYKMFQKWLERIPGASWNHLVAALNKTGMKNAANTVSGQFISGTVEERPTMKHLIEVIRIKNIGIAVRWYELGLELVDDNNILQLITADHGNDTRTCCRKMFEKWLERIPGASWNRLVAALNKIGMKNAANIVSEQFISAYAESINSVPQLKGSSSTYVSSSSINPWTRSYCNWAIIHCIAGVVIAVVIAFVLREHCNS